MLTRSRFSGAIDTTRFAAKDAISGARYQAKRTMKRVGGRVGHMADEARERMPEPEDLASHLFGTARRLMEKRPTACLAAVGFLGVLVGLSARSPR